MNTFHARKGHPLRDPSAQNRFRFGYALAALALSCSLTACGGSAADQSAEAGAAPSSTESSQAAESTAAPEPKSAEPTTEASGTQKNADQKDNAGKKDQADKEAATEKDQGREASSSGTASDNEESAEQPAAPGSWSKIKDGQELAKDAKAATQEPRRGDPVGLKQKVEAGAQASMSIERLERTKGEANGIGEVAGPGVLLEIRIENNGDKELDLAQAQVRLYSGKDRQPAALLTDERSTELPATLAAGKSTSAVYIFSAPATDDGKVAVEFETGSTDEIQQLAGEVRS